LSLISYCCIFKFWTNKVSTFGRMNLKLQTSKLSKVGSKWKVGTSSTNFRWSQTTLTSNFLWRGFENGQPNQLWLWHPVGKTTYFFHVFTLKNFSIDSYQRLTAFLLKSKGQKTVPWSSSLAKPLKSLKPKPSLQNQPSIKLLTVVFCPNPFHFN